MIVVYFHDLTIQRHGGLPGFQEGGEARLESTLIRPRNLLLYKDDATFPDLAATLIYGLAKNHCFNDGNKRVSAIAGGIFLAANGIVWRPIAMILSRRFWPLPLAHLSIKKNKSAT